MTDNTLFNNKIQENIITNTTDTHYNQRWQYWVFGNLESKLSSCDETELKSDKKINNTWEG